jgi:hypothetical protein
MAVEIARVPFGWPLRISRLHACSFPARLDRYAQVFAERSLLKALGQIFLVAAAAFAIR